jgi:hypothetical protein
MGQVTSALGQPSLSPFSSFGAGYDATSLYVPYNAYASAVTGAYGDSYSRPILFTDLTMPFTSSGATLQLQIATDAAGGGGAQSGTLTAASSLSWNPNYATFTKNSSNSNFNFYYGFQKQNSTTITWRRGASTNGAYNPNGIFVDGTSNSSWVTTANSGSVTWRHVPYAPNITTVTVSSPTSITLNWTHPADTGGSAITGWRIMYKLSSATNIAANWTVFGANATGSPAGTLAGATSAVVTGLNTANAYDFRLAAINAVSTAHNTDYRVKTAHIGTNAFATSLASPQNGKIYNGTAWVDGTAQIFDGINWVPGNFYVRNSANTAWLDW